MPPDRYYTTGSLFEAPDTITYQKQIKLDSDAVEKVATRAMKAVDSQNSNTPPERDVDRELFDNARREGRLVPATA